MLPDVVHSRDCIKKGILVGFALTYVLVDFLLSER